MNKFINYILKGKGIGILPLLLGSALLSIIVTLFIYINIRGILPTAQELRPILPITFKDNTIVDPIDQRKEAVIERFGGKYKVVLDTHEDELPEADLKEPGFYLSRRYFYSVDVRERKIERVPFEKVENEVFDENNLARVMDNIYFYVFAFFFVGLFLASFIFLLLMTIFFTLAFVLFRVKDKFSFESKMRLSALSTLFGALINVGISFAFEGSINFFVYAFFVILIQFKLISMARKQDACTENKD